MRNYENLVIIKPTLTAEEIQSVVTNIEEIITSSGGEITARDAMGMRKLAYLINKNERGYFHVVYYTAKPSSISEIERRFRINEELLRFVTIKYDTPREVKAWNQQVDKMNRMAAAETKEPAKAEEVAETSTEETVETPAKETAAE